jgi:hypothetical protein
LADLGCEKKKLVCNHGGGFFFLYYLELDYFFFFWKLPWPEFCTKKVVTGYTTSGKILQQQA